MKLSRRFYDSSINFKNISVKRIVLAIALGLASAFIIYSFFYVIRESFRVMSFGFANLPYILQEKDRNLYNIFFAGLSVVFANSITLNLLLSKPVKTLSRRNPIRRRILNDQVFLSFNFIYWFTKMGLCFLVFSMCCLDFDFSPYVGALSTLLLFVLYLDTWKSLSMIFKKNRLKVQCLHLLIMFFLTMGISRIDIIDYNSIDNLAIKSSTIYNLPHSDFHNKNNHNYNPEINLKIELLESYKLRITHYGKWFNIEDIPAIISTERASFREEMIPFLWVSITANKDIDLKYVKVVEAQLYAVNQYRIIYEIYNEDLLTTRFENRGIKHKIVKPIYSFEVNRNIPITPQPPMDNYIFKDTLNISIGNEIKINKLTYSKDKLIEKFKNNIDREILISYNFNSNTKYQDYINVLSCHFIAVNELRKQEQTIFVDSKYDYNEEYRKEQYKLKQKYPIRIIEKLD